MNVSVDLREALQIIQMQMILSTVDAIIFENRFEGIAQPRMHHFEKSLCLS